MRGRWAEAPATHGIAVLTLAVSLALLLSGQLQTMAVEWGFIPAVASGVVELPSALPAWLTPLSATLVHAGIAHLGFNLVMFVYCGRQAERALGSAGVAVLYLVGAYAAALGQWLPAPGAAVPMIGASGAISAVMGAYALLFGERRAKAIGPVPAGVVHVLWLAAAWTGIQLLIGVAGMGTGLPGGSAPVAIGAHIGGFAAGLALARPLLLWRWRDA